MAQHHMPLFSGSSGPAGPCSVRGLFWEGLHLLMFPRCSTPPVFLAQRPRNLQGSGDVPATSPLLTPPAVRSPPSDSPLLPSPCDKRQFRPVIQGNRAFSGPFIGSCVQSPFLHVWKSVHRVQGSGVGQPQWGHEAVLLLSSSCREPSRASLAVPMACAASVLAKPNVHLHVRISRLDQDISILLLCQFLFFTNVF